MFIILLFLCILFSPKIISGEKCDKLYSKDSFVCVCKDISCDTVGQIAPPNVGHYKVMSSSRDEYRFAINEYPLSNNSKDLEYDAKISVHEERQRQKMLGFGGAFTDAAGINIATLSTDLQELVIKHYFSTEGIEYNIGRVPIAGTDFSDHPYSYDDVPGDVDLKYFSLTKEDYLYKIPFIKMAKKFSKNNLLLFASPWAPPSWMKTNGMFNGTGGLMPEMQKPWADYIVRFLESYKYESLDFWGLTVQNEPRRGYVNSQPWNACGFSPEQERDFVKSYLGPTLNSSGYGNIMLMIVDDSREALPLYPDVNEPTMGLITPHPWNACGFTAEQERDFIKLYLGPGLNKGGYGDVNLMILDDSREVVILYPNVILADNEASKYVQGIAVHWYADNELPASLISQLHRNFPDKFILYSEACFEDLVGPGGAIKLGSWKRAEGYAYDIITNINHWSSGWTDWNLALDLIGGPNWAFNYVDAPVVINSTANEFYKQPMFYALGHFSKFVSEGAICLETSIKMNSRSRRDELFSASFLTPSNEIVVVLLSKSDEERTILVEDSSNNAILTTIPPRSIHTFVYSL